MAFSVWAPFRRVLRFLKTTREPFRWSVGSAVAALGVIVAVLAYMEVGSGREEPEDVAGLPAGPYLHPFPPLLPDPGRQSDILPEAFPQFSARPFSRAPLMPAAAAADMSVEFAGARRDTSSVEGSAAFLWEENVVRAPSVPGRITPCGTGVSVALRRDYTPGVAGSDFVTAYVGGAKIDVFPHSLTETCRIHAPQIEPVTREVMAATIRVEKRIEK